MAGVKTVKKGDRLIKEYVDKAGKIVKYEPGLKLEVSDFKGAWYPAKVLEVDEAENEVLVHYDKWSSRYDEWIKTDSNRLRPSSSTNVVQIQYKVGERVEALWSTDGLRYPGRIKAVLPNDYYEVLFDDGIKCKKKGSQIYKIQRITRGKAQELDKKQKRNSISGGASTELTAPTEPPLVKSPAKQKYAVEPASMPEDSVIEASEPAATETVPGAVGPEVAESPVLAAEVESPLPAGSPVPPPQTPDPDAVATSLSFSLTSKVSPSAAVATAAPAVTTPPVELGKRKRACHNYSLFLKVPRKSPKPENSVPKRKYVKKEAEPIVVPDEVETQDEEPPASSIPLDEPEVVIITPTVKKGRKSAKAAEVATDNSPMAPPQKRPRKYTARSSLSLSLSESTGLEPKQNGTGEPHADPTGPRFIDEQGNEVVVQQNADGAWICPIESCGKIFRKDSLLQMHLQHYHPKSNIKFLGKKLNVFEMAMEKAQKSTDSTYEVREKEHVDTSTVEQTTKRRRSTQVTPVPSQPSTPVPSTPTFTNPPITAEVVVKLTDITTELDRRDGKKFDEKHPEIIVEGSYHRVSQRGRPLHSRSWSKDQSIQECLSSDEDFKPDISSYKRMRSRRAKVILSDDEGIVQTASNAGSSHLGSYEAEAAEEISHKPVQKTERSKKFKPLRKQQQRPVFLTQRRRQKIAEQSAAENIKARKLEVINDELYNAGYRKRLKIQPTFEDVKVDVINCICSVKEEFGLMMQCELCQAWQHGNCYGVYEVTQLPPYYVCSYCRSPNNIRNSRKYEWYQEVNTTGKLPRFTFCATKEEPVMEEKMQGCNDLMNALASLQSMLRSTQVKISSLNTPGGQTAVAVEDIGDDPNREAASDDFKANFRPVLKHLLRCNRHDQSYIDKLRNHVVEALATKKDMKVCKNVEGRLHTRAAKVVKQKWGRKLQEVQIHPVISSDVGNSKSAFASCSNSDTTSPEQQDEKPSELAIFRQKLQSKLTGTGSVLIDSEDEQRKFVLLSLDDAYPEESSISSARLVVHAENGEVIGIGGTEEEDLHQGVHVVTVRKCDPEKDGCKGPMCSNSISVVPAGKLSVLHLCTLCKSSLGVQWNKADFVASERLQVSFIETSEKKNTGAAVVGNLQTPFWPSLKELSIAKMKELDVPLPELVSASQAVESVNADVHGSTTGRCQENHANVKTRIIREQALLDSYLDTIEIKLKDLENGEPCDTDILMGKLKDLEELKVKVDQINQSMSLLRERETFQAQKQQPYWATGENVSSTCP